MEPNKTIKLPSVNPVSDLVFTGTVLGVQDDTVHYVSKKTGLNTEMKRQVIVLQTSFGIVLCRVFNPQFDYSSIPVGMKGDFAINEFRIDNGVKTAVVKA